MPAKENVSDHEDTPEQRRVIDDELAEARKGPYYGPFDTADEAIKFLRKEIRKRKSDESGRSGKSLMIV